MNTKMNHPPGFMLVSVAAALFFVLLYGSVSVQSYRARQEKGFLLKSAEPDYWDEEVHLGTESFVDPDVTSQYVGKRRWL